MKRFSPDVVSTLTRQPRHGRARAMLFIGLIACVGGFTRTALAALIQVDTTSNFEQNDGVCTLVEAVKAINNNAPFKGCEGGSSFTGIQLPNGTINSGSMFLTRAATIQGNGLTASAINFTSSGTGCGVSVTVGANLTNLTLQQAAGINIAGLCGSGGSVVLNGVRVRSFQNGGIAMFSGGISGNNIRIENNHSFGDGGGIWVNETADMGTFSKISITNNIADGRGGGIAAFGHGNPAMNNCTISGNQADQGGGIYSLGPYLDVSNCTIASNTANVGGGIYSYPAPDFSGYIRINRSIIVSNVATGGVGANFFGEPGYQLTCNSEWNLWGGPFDSSQDGIAHGAGDESVSTASIGAESTGLSNTGAPFSLAMFPLRSTALSLDKVPSGCMPTDIRGVARPRGPACDKGSFER